ncbi:hypothetical protein P7K49_025785 [Saguinus oedipus]|uniref:Uncharacterized protein n=1 Tax=Saguinus oedipus TaxID=9490 RepID=A0ABQ9UI77_SAGOE|nr:hypothetical protein P7K49_025785 [Saguinus oedipus]
MRSLHLAHQETEVLKEPELGRAPQGAFGTGSRAFREGPGLGLLCLSRHQTGDLSMAGDTGRVDTQEPMQSTVDFQQSQTATCFQSIIAKRWPVGTHWEPRAADKVNGEEQIVRMESPDPGKAAQLLQKLIVPVTPGSP